MEKDQIAVFDQRISALERYKIEQGQVNKYTQEQIAENKRDIKELDSRLDISERLFERMDVTLSGVAREVTTINKKFDRLIDKQEQAAKEGAAAALQEEKSKAAAFQQIAFKVIQWLLIGLLSAAGLKGVADWLGAANFFQ